MATALEVNHLVKHFGSTQAVDDLSFTVEAGEVFGFLGPNGAGKTTTIRCLVDFLRPTRGSIKVFGLDSARQGVAARQRIGFMPPVTALNERWTGQAHVDYVGRLHATHNQASELAQQMEFDLTRPVKQLSTGNRQKLALILAFMHQAELIVLDEPTTGLDPLLQQRVYQLIQAAQHRGATVFMSSHNLSEVERTCSRVAILRQGKLVSTEPMSRLKEKHLYTVSVDFDREYTLPAMENASLISRDPRTTVLKVSGDIAPLLTALANAPVHDVQIQHATLEEMFMEHYNR